MNRVNVPGKEVRALLDEVRQHRPDVELQRGSHLKLKAPGMPTAVVPSTPGRGRAMANTRAQLRRLGYLP